MSNKKYIIYQITNKINKMIYIGCHVTENINDAYKGSGTNIKKAIKEFGMENFEKIILFQFDNKEDMLAKEKELVNLNFIAREDTYNIIIGGNTFLTLDTVSVKDKDGNYLKVHKTDSRYLSGELVGVTFGKLAIKDKNGNTFQVDKNDERYLSGELVCISKGLVSVKDKDGNTFSVSIKDTRYLNGELVSVTKDLLTVKDKDGNIFSVNNKDERYLSGELVSIWKDRKHSEESKKKIGEKNSKMIGEKNSMYGRNHSEESKDKIRNSLDSSQFEKVFYVYDKQKKFISQEKGIARYAKEHGLSRTGILTALSGRSKSSGGLIFSYIKF